MTSIFEGQPLKTRPFHTKRRVIWVPGKYIFVYYNWIIHIIYNIEMTRCKQRQYLYRYMVLLSYLENIAISIGKSDAFVWSGFCHPIESNRHESCVSIFTYKQNQIHVPTACGAARSPVCIYTCISKHEDQVLWCTYDVLLNDMYFCASTSTSGIPCSHPKKAGIWNRCRGRVPKTPCPAKWMLAQRSTTS